MSQLTSQIARYLQMCRLEKNLSPDTLKAYRIDLTQFAAFAQDAAVDKALLGRYAAHLNQHFAPRSVKRKLASIRAFYSSLEEQEAIEESPFNALNDTCTMQLVNWRNHTGTIPHAGGCVQYAEAHGRPYRGVGPMASEDLQELLDDLTAPTPVQHSTKELGAFTLSTGKELSSELRQLLLGQRTVSKEGLMTLASKHDLCLDALLPLTDSPECANITDVMTRFGRCELTLSATPLFIDPYGNEVWVADGGTMYLCDHETDTLELIDQDLWEILE